MRNLKLEELAVVNGGDGPTNAETVAANAATAVTVCGRDNVQSVTTEGFTCKPD